MRERRLTGLKNRLPPANALVVFECAARHLNFTRASQELRIAQPAVTRQIKKLENDLQVRLFNRQNNKLSLTSEGEKMLRVTGESLQKIASLAETFRNMPTEKLLIGSTFAFANLWLAPRLPALRRTLPGVNLNLLISENYEEFDSANTDFSIRFGHGQWSGMISHLLFAEKVYPVATKRYVAQYGLNDSTNWQDVTLLDQQSSAKLQGWLTWKEWLQKTRNTLSQNCRIVDFENYIYVLDAVRNDEGIALGMSGLTDEFEAQNDLVCVGQAVNKRRSGYYLVYPEWYPRPQTISAVMSVLS